MDTGVTNYTGTTQSETQVGLSNKTLHEKHSIIRSETARQPLETTYKVQHTVQTGTEIYNDTEMSQLQRKPIDLTSDKETKEIPTSEMPTEPSHLTSTKPKVKIAVNHNQGYIWNPRDVLRLWRDFRVVGSLVGSLPRHPHQSCTLGLPMSLLPEEVTLLVEEGLAETVRYKELGERPQEVLVDAFNECRERCYEEQVQEAARQRREEVRRMAHKILEGKRKKFMMKLNKDKTESIGNNEADKQTELPETTKETRELSNGMQFTLTIEDVIQEQEERLQPLSRHLQVLEIFTGQPLLDRLTPEHYHWSHPTTHDEELRYRVFRNLWHKGFYLTSGLKFGGHFLVYSGDPHLYHAHSIVRCVKRKELGELDLVASTRVAASTKKTFVLAYLDGDEVAYQSYHWFEEHEEEEEEEEEEVEVMDFDEEL